MTFKTTVVDSAGVPIQNAIVDAGDQIAGRVFKRGTDGGGYADMAMFNVPHNTPITLTVQAPGYANGIVYLTTSADNSDQVVKVTLASFKSRFKPAPRVWAGNMCGVRIPGLTPVAGGADPSLVLSWFYDRYPAGERQQIRDNWRAQGYTHTLLSWPDSRAAGATPDSFAATCRELVGDGFYPAVMLCSKDFDPADVDSILAGIAPVLRATVGLVPIFCVGWELSLWLTPTQVQQLTDAIHPIVHRVEGTLLFVHFQQGYPSFQQPGGTVADYWHAQVGKLNGLLYQKFIDQNDVAFLDSLSDCLQRFCGGFNMPDDSGFGYPFIFTALEISAMTQYNDSCSEAEGDRLGRLAINAPACYGPTGARAAVSGVGNGF